MSDLDAAGPRSRRIALPTGLTYHLLEWNPAGARTVLLVHGFLDLAWTWAPIAERLAAAGHHVVALDLRGHGDSDWIGRGGYYHFFDYVADVDHVVARVAHAQLAVVGHSMGGSVVAYWAGTRPARLTRLALLEGIGPPEAGPDLPGRTRGWIDNWAAARLRTFKPMADVATAAARLRKNDPLLAEADALFLAQRGTRVTSSGGRVWKHDPVHLTQGPYPFRVDAAATFWRAVTAPTLYLGGERSMLRLPDPDIAARLAVFPSARHATIAAAGHALQRHQPAAVADALLAHFG